MGLQKGTVIMSYIIKHLEVKEAKEILKWKYEEPYSIYSFTESEEELEELMDGSYYSVKNENGTLIGYYCYGKSAQVPAGNEYGIYNNTEFLDFGLGMRPDFTGQGSGGEFVLQGINYAKEKFNAKNIRLTVAAFNERAVRVYEKNGFKKGKVFERRGKQGNLQFVTMSFEA